MATRNLVPRANGEGGIGTTVKRWLHGYFQHFNGQSVSETGLATEGAPGMVELATPAEALAGEDSVRAVTPAALAAALAVWSEEIAATYVSASSFTVGAVGQFTIGLRVRADCGVDGDRFGLVASIDGVNVTLTMDTGQALTGNLVGVFVSSRIPSAEAVGAIPVAARGAAEGVAPLDGSAMVPTTNLPSASALGAIPATARGAAEGVAPLDGDTKVPAANLPSAAALGAIPATARGAAEGVAPLDGDTKVPAANLPSASESAPGAMELATEAEALTGEDMGRAMTPATAKAAVDAAIEVGLATVPRENLIVDGNFDFWLEATSQTSNGYGSDTMWHNGNSGSTKTHSQQQFSLGDTDGWDATAKYYSRSVVSSATGASNYCNKIHFVEDVRKTAGRNVTLSFRAKANVACNMGVEFIQNFGSGGSPSATVTGIGSQLVALTTAWQKYEITVAIPNISTKTLGTNNNDHLGLIFWFDAGSNYAARSASLGQQSGIFDLAQIKLEIGDFATPFVAPEFDKEYRRLARYYQEIGGGVLVDFGGYIYMCVTTGNGNQFGKDIQLPVIMRASPTGTKVGTWSVNNCGQPAISSVNRRGFSVYAVATSTTSTCYFHSSGGCVTLDARIS